MKVFRHRSVIILLVGRNPVNFFAILAAICTRVPDQLHYLCFVFEIAKLNKLFQRYMHVPWPVAEFIDKLGRNPQVLESLLFEWHVSLLLEHQRIRVFLVVREKFHSCRMQLDISRLP
jgi:hypothetical protein